MPDASARSLSETFRLAFEDKVILEKLDLKVARGERLVIMGQSGSGKSTTLRLIMGILRPTAGRVFFKGEEVTRMNRTRLNRMRQRIGMVYQYSALISSLSVRDNLALPLEELTDKTEKEINEIVEEKLALVGMEDTRAYMPSELSGGMKKRIGLARALVLEPELILFDEPTAGLDPVVSSVIDELIICLERKNQRHLDYRHPRNGQRLPRRHPHGHALPWQNHRGGPAGAVPPLE